MRKTILLTSIFFCCFKFIIGQRLDPSFGGKGFVTTVFKKGNFLFEAARQILPQKDGTYIAVIEADGRTALAHFFSNGKLDSSFADKGYSEFISTSEAKAVQQSDGKIVVAGNDYNGQTNFDFSLTRFNPDGSTDFTFGEDGEVTTDFGSDDHISSVALQPNGNIIAAGYTSTETTNFDFAVARYTSAGALDLSFNNDGKLTQDFYGWQDMISSAVVQADGKIVVSGTTFKPATCDRCAPEDGQSEFTLMRYNNDGSSDHSFDKDGKTIIDFSDGDASSLALQADGKIIVASSNSDLILSRYNGNGSLDVSFGSAGNISTDFGFNEYPASVAIQPDGKIVLTALLGGYTETDSQDFALLRYNSNGTPDINFGVNGKVTTDFGFNEFANSAAIQSDGKIVVAGGSYNEKINDEDFAFARYNSNGSLDNSFSGDGKKLGYYLTGISELYSIATQSDGKILVAGSSYNSRDSYGFGVARYNSDGTLDGGFDKDGKVITNFETNAYANAIALQSDGKILVGGGEKLVRYNSNGALDYTFDKDGKISAGFFIRSIKLQKDGKIVIAGVATDDNFRASFALARYNSNGSLDAGFDGDGKLTTHFFGDDDQAFSVALQSDGKIVVAGQTYNRNTLIDFALARYNSNGSPDVSFDGNGKVTTDFSGFNDFVSSVTIQSDGKIVVAGNSSNDDTNSEDFAVARYNKNGSLDTLFSKDGKLTTNFNYADVIYSSVIQSDGKIVVAGLTSDINYADDIALARYNNNGSLDSGFNGDGRLVTDLGRNERANAAAIFNGKLYITGNDLIVAYDLKAGANKAPVVSITSPANNAVYYAPAVIKLKGSAADADGTIRNVEFYNGSTLLKTDSISPYTYSLNISEPGDYSFTAKATDNQGTPTTSAVVQVSVLANSAPAVHITSPANNAVYYAPATINLRASATDADGYISDVKFYNGTTLLKTEYYYPYTYTWSNVLPGNYSITAKATDNHGAVTASAVVHITVNANKAPIVSITSPVNNAVYTAPATIYLRAAAHDVGDTINNVKFYNGTTLLKTEYYYPYTYTLPGVAAGTYSFTAKATDNHGRATESAVVHISVKAPNAIIAKGHSVNETGTDNPLSLKLSPNPASGVLHIYTKGLQLNKQVTISIFSAAGVAIKTVQSINSADKGLQVNVSSLAGGVYTIKLICANNVLYKQFVKL